MGVQGAKKSAEAPHEIFMGIFLIPFFFLFCAAFPSRYQKGESVQADVLTLEAQKGASLTFWGVADNIRLSSLTSVGPG